MSSNSMAVQIAQTVALIAATLLSLATLAYSQIDRRRDRRQARLDKVLTAGLDVSNTYAQWKEQPGQDEHFSAAYQRLRAALALVHSEALQQADLLARGVDIMSIPAQVDSAIGEIQRNSDSLDAMSWWGVLRRQPLES
jgi:hypothetical protein